MQKQLKDLNLLDDFLFFSLLNDEVVGEAFGRKLLEIIFNKKIGKLKIIPQKVFYGVDTDKHGIRLDVFMEEDTDSETLLENATIFDIEPETESKKSKLNELPKRIRFYHSMIDVGSLGKGQEYEYLKKVIVVMIMPFDPFGYDHIIYTIQNTCMEVPELPYNDGAKTLFLYTKGKKGNPTKALRELLCYMENSQKENVKNDDLDAINSMVNTVKENVGVSLEYMKMFEKERMIREEGQILGAIKMARKYGATKEEIVSEIAKEYRMSEDVAKEIYEEMVKTL